MKKMIPCLILVSFLMQGCSKSYDTSFEYDEGLVKLEMKNDSLSYLRYIKEEQIISTIVLPYPVYQFDWGDVNNDGLPEVVVGVIKSTYFFPKKDKRLFIYHLDGDGQLSPMWLGSRVSCQLLDFKVERDSVPALVHTLELGADSNLYEVMYEQRGFGLRYKRHWPSVCKDSILRRFQ